MKRRRLIKAINNGDFYSLVDMRHEERSASED